jgi:hypothetical protein
MEATLSVSLQIQEAACCAMKMRYPTRETGYFFVTITCGTVMGPLVSHFLRTGNRGRGSTGEKNILKGPVHAKLNCAN